MSEYDLKLTDNEIALLRTSRGLDHVRTDDLDAVIEHLAPTVELILADRLAAVQAERDRISSALAAANDKRRILRVAVKSAKQERDDARRRLAEVEAVLGEHFDFGADPWEDHDAACPAPEDIWRLHRDLRAALANPPTEGGQP